LENRLGRPFPFRTQRGVGDRLSGESLTAQGVWRCVEKYSDVASHDLRRTYAKLAHKGDAKLDQIQLSLGHASLTTTERYLGVHQPGLDNGGFFYAYDYSVQVASQ
jgi:integrase